MWILAHRGASKQAPENTRKAFRLAMEQQATGIEFDTYQVEDEIIVIHDRRLERTTNGHGQINNSSLDYLRSLDAGEGEHIPFLTDALGCLPADAICNIEIKSLYDIPRWLQSLDASLRHIAMPRENIIVSSFNHRWLKRIHQLEPDLKLGALTSSYPEEGVEFARKLNAYSVHVSLDVVDEELVRIAKAEGLQILVFTVDDPMDMQMLRDWGVDGIFTNVPDEARRALY
ncbi:glycerophosphodiester phosphodiesterase [Salinimonas sp. HHU 13199]|uniref:Glycerophosphodiester phosphodiesterase n=1 Tax=Salinimonas profundi TaxID=2729140 RepID=A0ABR8LN52_9ALTE|nr:glycerophosphodiester phosphodiesterase family protein [Salinimonas profundi]MBD3586798.1 glycerophosphodiester phosphodiesterase [Salinimonas profundi]